MTTKRTGRMCTKQQSTNLISKSERPLLENKPLCRRIPSSFGSPNTPSFSKAGSQMLASKSTGTSEAFFERPDDLSKMIPKPSFSTKLLTESQHLSAEST